MYPGVPTLGYGLGLIQQLDMTMHYTRLGRTGLKVSRLCLGTLSFGQPTAERPWALTPEDARPIIRRAWEAGINFFDTANVYLDGLSEEVTGALLKEIAPREDFVLATKVRFNNRRTGPNGPGLSRKAILHEIDESLRRLGTDYVDLYQIHRADPETPAEETMEALHDLVRAGKVRYIGASSMYAWEFLKYQRAAERNGWTRFVSMQNYISLVYREEEREMLPLCADDGIGVIPWSPLAAGKLTRPWGAQTVRSSGDVFAKTMYDENDNNDRAIVAATEQLAQRRGVSMAQIALAWHFHKPVISAPILGVSRLSNLEDALGALDVALSPDEIAELETPYRVSGVRGI